MTTGLSLLAVLVLSLGVQPARAASASLPAPILLWASDAPEAKGVTAADRPALHPFLPPADQTTGGAVLIVPGVAFNGRDQGNEGVQMARWLTERGIAGFVLRARPPSSDASAAAADLNRAVRLLRARAAEHKISPRRIAVLGFGRGAELAAQAVYESAGEGKADATDPVEKFSSRPELLALIWGAHVPAAVPAPSPTTFIVGSTSPADNMNATIDLWTKLRGARVPVDAHFFPQAAATAGLALEHPSLGSWPESFYAWARFNGFLTDEPRVPLKGMVYLDGRVLPHGYVIFTPIDFVGAGPIVGRVFNSSANQPLGQFIVPANQGPIPGRYKVDVRQNMNRWLSNSFSGALVSARGGAPTPEQVHFGHHRALAPSIDDQKSFTKVRPSDRQDYVIEIKPGADANLDLKIEVFSK